MLKKVAFHTLGCKLNFSETSTIARTFSEKGYERVKFGEPADIVLLNTCSVTETADKKCRQAIKKAKAKSENTFIAVTGCFAQLQTEKIAKIPGVDIVLGIKDKFKIFDHINNFEKQKTSNIYSCEISEVSEFDGAFSLSDRTRSFLKIQDGCDYPCAYCTIPKARGKSRNTTINETIKNAEKIAEAGIKEIILTGVNVGDFGRSTGENFFDLIKELDKVKGISRYRISSIEPNLLTDEIIEFTSKYEKFLPHFHIPLQSGSNKILSLMKRRYKKELFAEKINKIRKTIPQAFIGVDVIVGFPGETDNDFQETYKFLENSDISFIHVFSYSDRPGTKSISMEGKINPAEIKKRSKKLHELSEQKHFKFYKSNIDTIQNVLYEQKKGDFIFGFTENYIKVRSKFNENLINKIKNVKIIRITEKPKLFAEV